MPFGVHPTSDRLRTALEFEQNASVTNAFRRSPDFRHVSDSALCGATHKTSPMPFGVHPTSDTPLSSSQTTSYSRSPMPFGVHPTSDTGLRGMATIGFRIVTNAFRRSPDFRLFAGINASFCVRQTSPMPFGVHLTSDSWPSNPLRRKMQARPKVRGGGVRQEIDSRFTTKN